MIKFEKELRKEMFEEVICFSFSETGSMGPSGTMSVMNSNGKVYHINYLSEETPYNKIKEYFPEFRDLYWNGPMKGESEGDGGIRIGGDYSKTTRIPVGFRHLYLNLGNHLCIREDLYDEIVKLFDGMSKCDITFDWVDVLNKSNIFGEV